MSQPQEKLMNARPESLIDVATHFCPGCHHGIVHRLVAEAIDHFGLREKSVGVACVGCSVFLYNYLNTDVVEAPHGRAPAVATGMKRAQPEKLIYTYQGDGDLAAIGTAEIIHAANRGERITVVFVNNTTYGMTGGQMAPTTLLGMKATTAPEGRKETRDGYPLDLSHLIAEIPGSAYVVRTTVTSPKTIRQTKQAIREAFQCQLDEEGFSLVEVLSMCPTNWKMDPLQSCAWIDEVMSKHYQPGVLVDRRKKKKAAAAEAAGG